MKKIREEKQEIIFKLRCKRCGKLFERKLENFISRKCPFCRKGLISVLGYDKIPESFIISHSRGFAEKIKVR